MAAKEHGNRGMSRNYEGAKMRKSVFVDIVKRHMLPNVIFEKMPSEPPKSLKLVPTDIMNTILVKNMSCHE